MVRPSSINTMTAERAKKAPKTHRIRDRPILWVFRKTMDAEVKIPDPIQRTPVRRPILRPAFARELLDLPIIRLEIKQRVE